MRRRALALFAAVATPAAAQERAAVERALAALVAAPALAGARAGVEVRDLATGEVLAAHDADKGFLPASNMKLIATAVALQTLGPDFTFATRVVAAAAPHDGVVAGDLFLVGDGDPSLGGRPEPDAMAPLRALADQLFAAGVRAVQGRVLGGGRSALHEPYGRGWQWDYLDDDYAAPCAVLNFAENVVEVVVAAGKNDAQPTVRQQPDVGALRCELDVQRAAAATAAALHFARPLRDEWLHVTGTLADDGKEQRLRVAVTDPCAYAARAWLCALRDRGIEVRSGADSLERAGAALPPAPVQLAELRSPPLARLLVTTLEHSINLYAEQLWRTAAVHGGDPRASADCEQFAKSVLQKLGVDVQGMVLADGSGLSRRDLVQPRQLVALLACIHGSDRLRGIEAALPVAGRSGTLHTRLAGNATRDHVRAKTGFVSYVACLSGYVDRPGGAPPLAFAVMLNNFTCETDAAKAAIDGFVERLAVASGWSP